MAKRWMISLTWLFTFDLQNNLREIRKPKSISQFQDPFQSSLSPENPNPESKLDWGYQYNTWGHTPNTPNIPKIRQLLHYLHI